MLADIKALTFDTGGTVLGTPAFVRPSRTQARSTAYRPTGPRSPTNIAVARSRRC
jgi:hypothetical protein